MNVRIQSRTTVCAAIALLALATRPALGANFPEVEPNESKALATANGTITLAPGDTLSGTTTGSSTVAGATSLDQFRIRTETAPFGLYKYQLAITTAGTAGHAGTIRGLTQTSGVIGTGDTTFQTSSTLTTPARMNQWYDFGGGGELYYRITGTASTTGAYTSTLTRTQITPLTGPTLNPGPITISTIGQTTSDTEIWVYDSTGAPIADFGNDDESVAGGGTGVTTQSLLTRTFTPGTYYAAISNIEMGNNLASPADDDYRNGLVVDFANVTVCSSTSTNLVMNPKFTDSAGTTTVTATKAAAYDIVWIQFTVAVPTTPTGSGSFSPSTVAQGCQTELSVEVTPAPGQPNNEIVSVTADLTSINASLPGSFALTDGGAGTWTGTVSVPGDTTIGAKIVTCTITDAGARVGTCQATATVSAYLSMTGSAAPNQVVNGASTTLSAVVNQAAGACTASSGMTVIADLSTIGGSASQALTDSGDGINFSFLAAVSATDGAKTLPVTAMDAEGRTANASIALTVGYCTASHASVDCTGGDEYISNVTVGSINNSSSCVVSPAYEDYTAQSTDMSPDTMVPISVTVSEWFSTTDRVSVFCDWNQNLVLDEPGEVTVLTDGGAPNHIYSGNISVPAGAMLGATRMRVRLAFAVPTACGTSGTGFGNIEDYTVVVSPPINPIVTNPLANPASGGVGTTTQLTANVALATPPFPINSVVVDLTNIGGAAGVQMFDDGAHGDGGVGDGLYGISATVQVGASPGPKLLQVTATDSNAGVGMANIAFHVCDSDTTGCTGFPQPFDGTAGLPTCWVSVNNSPGGPGTNPNWNMTDGAATFPPHSGTGFVAANFNSATGANDISNYLMSPIIPAMKNGDHIKFWTRSINSTFPDRMSVLISTNGGCTSPADFQANPALLVINPTLTVGGYPGAWTEFDVEVTGVTGTVSGRFAFWYNVPNAGPDGTASDYIGVDDVDYIVATTACSCLGDTSADLTVNGLDVSSFTACVLSGGGGCGCADMDHSTTVDLNDIPGFISALLDGNCGP